MDIVFAIPVLKDNYVWCLQKGNNCVVFDPGQANPVIDVLRHQNLNLCAILVTHHHYDHTHGIADILNYHDVPVYGPKEIAQVTHPIKKEGKLTLPHLKTVFSIISIPGHTLEHIAYYHPGMLFTGDTLFTGGCGKVFEGTSEQMYESLLKLSLLPEETSIYCGHEYTENNLRFAELVEPTNLDIKHRLKNTLQLRQKKLPTVPATLQIEKKTNPFLRCDQSEVIASASNYSGLKLTDSPQVFKVLREWKNNVTL